jgi:L-2,4-diaminobutyrate decarboxylase
MAARALTYRRSPPSHGSVASLAATVGGISALRDFAVVTLDALADGGRKRGGPIPPGGPERVADAVRSALPTILPTDGAGAVQALETVVRAVAAGAADPADPLCAAHLHVPPLAVAAAADLAATVLNPSLDSWDQAPAASEVERLVVEAVAGLVYPGAAIADAIVTTGATESNLVALLLAREQRRDEGPVRLICSNEAHHSVGRAAWMLGLPPPVLVRTRGGRMDLADLADMLSATPGPRFVVATAGTTGRGVIDPLEEITELARAGDAHVHVDAAYGGGLLFCNERRQLLNGLELADSVALDLHKFGWQPLPAGLLAVADTAMLEPLSLVTDYLNPDDDQEAGLPDLLGRSIRTSRRPDALKMAVTFQALGRTGLARLIDRCCAAAAKLADRIEDRPGLRLLGRPEISTVLFRPTIIDELDSSPGALLVANIRRTLMTDGRAVLGRATVTERERSPQLWLKLTLLNPEINTADLDHILDLVERAAHTARSQAA